MNTAQKIALVQKHLVENDIAALIIPCASEHDSYANRGCDQHLNWISDFSGSAGYGVITKDSNALFVDGRYTLQAQNESGEFWQIHSINQVSTWITNNCAAADIIMVDYRHINCQQYKRWSTSLQLRDASGLIDQLWQNKPTAQYHKGFIYDEKYSGLSHTEKITQLFIQLKKQNCDYFVTNDSPSVCWLLNIRGQDIPNLPVVISRMIVDVANEKIMLFINKATRQSLSEHLQDIQLFDYDEFYDCLAKHKNNTSSWFCDYDDNCALINQIGPTMSHITCPIKLTKSIKNSTEINAIQEVHRIDGAAVIKLLYWIEQNYAKGLNEWEIAQKSYELRAQSTRFLQNSFEPIVGFQGNGAIIHYHPHITNSAPIKEQGLLLIDSGGQYLGGTTDITRVLPIGTPTPQQCCDYTLVLKAHINLAMAKFPHDTPGQTLDVIARHILWQYEKDYQHGTGHGVGNCLNVHEGPQNISHRGQVTMKPGMVCSNEPGFYLSGQHGIRLESLILIKELNSQWLYTDTISMVPMDKRLINFKMLTTTEIVWLNNYHQSVLINTEDLIDDDDCKKWLYGMCLAV